jgi:hypothetical protein
MGLQQTILDCLARTPSGMMQRYDGLRCERELIDYSEERISLALWLLQIRGLVKKQYRRHSIFASANNIPFYSLAHPAEQQPEEPRR